MLWRLLALPFLLLPCAPYRQRLQRLRRDLTDQREFAARFGFEPIEDRPLQAAVDVLQGVDLFVARSQPAPGKAAGP